MFQALLESLYASQFTFTVKFRLDSNNLRYSIQSHLLDIVTPLTRLQRDRCSMARHPHAHRRASF